MDYGREVKFGVFVIPATMQPTRALDVASIADELGFDLVGVQDHPYQWRFYDTWTLLVAIAMRTERITVFPDVASLPMRPPAVLAKAGLGLAWPLLVWQLGLVSNEEKEYLRGLYRETARWLMAPLPRGGRPSAVEPDLAESR